jgi:hypothetical protein
VIRNIEVANRAWRYRAATRFDATRTIQQQYASPASCKIMRCSGAGGPTANDDNIELFVV